MPEHMFGPYRLDGLLGSGGMGEVHRAYDTTRDRAVALKLLPAALAADEDYRARFRRESALVARLTEPHIVPVHDFGEIDGTLYLDMRLVEGEDLAAVLRREGRLPAGRAVAVIAQVADALDAAHAARLVHRDVKPSNVLVSGSREFVHLVDFGIARPIAEAGDGAEALLTRSAALIGTPAYMAPERFRDPDAPFDHRVDVYALACLLFHVLTGRPPFDSPDVLTAAQGHLFRDPPRPSQSVPGLPAALDEVVARGMAKEAADRYPSAGALADAARAAQAGPAAAADGRGAQAGPAAPADLPATNRPSPIGEPGPTEVPDPTQAGTDPLPDLRAAPIPAPPPGPPPASPGGTGPRPPSGPADPRGARRRWLPVAVVGATAATVGAALLVPLALDRTCTPAPLTAAVAADGVQGVGDLSDLALSADGCRLFMLSRTGARLAVLDTTTDTVVTSVAVPVESRDLALSPDGERLYVAGYGTDVVAVVDTATAAVVAEIAVPSGPRGVAVTPDGETVVVAGEPPVAVVETATGIVDRADGGAGAGRLALAPDGTRAYALDLYGGTLTIVDLATLAVTATVAVGGEPSDVAVSPDGTRVYVSSATGGDVAVVDPAAGRVLDRVPVGESPAGLLVTDDAVYVALVGTGEVAVLDPAGGAVTDRFDVGGAPQDVALHPAGDRLYVARGSEGALGVLDLDRRR